VISQATSQVSLCVTPIYNSCAIKLCTTLIEFRKSYPIVSKIFRWEATLNLWLHQDFVSAIFRQDNMLHDYMWKIHEELIPIYLLWFPHVVSVDKQSSNYIAVKCRWSYYGDPQVCPSSSSDFTQFVFLFWDHTNYFFNERRVKSWKAVKKLWRLLSPIDTSLSACERENILLYNYVTNFC